MFPAAKFVAICYTATGNKYTLIMMDPEYKMQTPASFLSRLHSSSDRSALYPRGVEKNHRLTWKIKIYLANYRKKSIRKFNLANFFFI